MDRIFDKLKAQEDRRKELLTAANKAPPPPTPEQTKEGGEALNHKDEFEAQWQTFVHRARIHEMLKCLQAEHKRLQVLRKHIDFEGLADDKKKDSMEEEDAESVFGAQSRTSKASASLRSAKTVGSEANRLNRVRKSLMIVDPEKRAEWAKDVFKTKNVITDDDFKGILDLCDDKLEKQALQDAFDEKKKREKYLTGASESRIMLYDFINSKFFVQFMLITVFVSIAGIFLLTFETISIKYSQVLMILDSCIIAIFIVEAGLKITIYKLDYFAEYWNLLDILIIIVYIVEVTVELITKTVAVSTDINSSMVFKFLKSLRALRLLRVIKFLPNLQMVLSTVIQSFVSLGSISLLMLLFMFVFAVMGRGLFSEVNPEHFGRIDVVGITLFTLLTLDDWFVLLDPVKSPRGKNEPGSNSVEFWLMFFYLFTYIVIQVLVFLNLFVAVLVDNFQLSLDDEEIRKKKDALEAMEETQHLEDYILDDTEETEENMINGADSAFFNKLKGRKAEDSELKVEDYYPGMNPEEAKAMGDVFKDLSALDFERLMLKRRMTLLNMIIDQALDAQRTQWSKDGQSHQPESK